VRGRRGRNSSLRRGKQFGNAATKASLNVAPQAKVDEDFIREAQEDTEAISGNIATAKRTNYPHQVVPNTSSVTALTRKNTSVAIQGPEMVAVRADAIIMTLAQLAPMTFTPGAGGNEARVLELFSRLSQFMPQFNDEARAALEDHGQEPEVYLGQG
jgi:hypothetical protein